MRRPVPPEGPVFVDRSGRRRRVVMITGVGLAAVLVAGLLVLAVGLSSASGLHVPGFPDLGAPATGAAPEPTGSATAPASAPGNPGGGVATTAVSGGAASSSASSPRRIPTQTPSHDPKPTKT